MKSMFSLENLHFGGSSLIARKIGHNSILDHVYRHSIRIEYCSDVAAMITDE